MRDDLLYIVQNPCRVIANIRFTTRTDDAKPTRLEKLAESADRS
jgi:hypothetical protein